MKDKIKNGYFFRMRGRAFYLKVGSRAYLLPLYKIDKFSYIMFKDIEEEGIQEVFKPNGERVE